MKRKWIDNESIEKARARWRGDINLIREAWTGFVKDRFYGRVFVISLSLILGEHPLTIGQKDLGNLCHHVFHGFQDLVLHNREHNEIEFVAPFAKLIRV